MAFLFLVILPVGVYARQANPKPITEKDYYDFYNAVPQPYKLSHFVLLSEPERFDTFNNLFEEKGKLFDTIFSKSDSVFLMQQISKAANFFWGPGMIDGAKVGNKADIEGIINNSGWNRFYSIYHVNSYCQYSVPLFSADRTICITLCSEHCGDLCGEGDVNYYKKINGKWQLVYHYVRWIS